MTKAKRRIHSFDFDGENAAVSLVSKEVGGAANGYTTLITKSTDVVVELSMAEFLNKFFDMWGYEASVLADMLGYSADNDLWDEEALAQKVTIMKQMNENRENGYNESDMVQVADLVKSVAERNGTKISDLELILKSDAEQDIAKSADGEEPVSDNKTTSPTQEDDLMTDKTQSVELEKALADLAEQQELIKSLQSYKEQVEKEKAEKVQAEMTELAKSLDVAEDKVAGMAVALFKAQLDADTAPLVELVKSQQTLIKGMEDSEPKGHEQSFESEIEDPNELIMKQLKAQVAK